MQNINYPLYLLQIKYHSYMWGLGWCFCDDKENSLVINDSDNDDLNIFINNLYI
jgi:hypothetical protein